MTNANPVIRLIYWLQVPAPIADFEFHCRSLLSCPFHANSPTVGRAVSKEGQLGH